MYPPCPIVELSILLSPILCPPSTPSKELMIKGGHIDEHVQVLIRQANKGP